MYHFDSFSRSTFLLIALFVITWSNAHSNENSIDTIEKRISHSREALEQLRKKKNETLISIENTKTTRSGVLIKLKSINKKIKQRRLNILSIQEKSKLTQNEIKQLTKALENLEKEIEHDQKMVDQQLHAMFYLMKAKQMTLFPGFNSLKNYFRNQKMLQGNIHLDVQLIITLNKKYKDQNQKKLTLHKQSQELKKLYKKEEEQKELFRFEREQQYAYLRHLNKDQKLRFKYLQEVQVELENINDTIFSLNQTYIIAQKQKKSKGFKKQIHNLPSPVSGKLLRSFGQKGSLFYRLYQRGVLVETSEDQDVLAVLPGKVVFSGPFRGYEILVIIDHGNASYSVYGNLEEVFVLEGDLVKQGTEIGIVAFNVLKNKYLFYFETRFIKKAVNPIQWLKKTLLEKNINENSNIRKISSKLFLYERFIHFIIKRRWI